MGQDQHTLRSDDKKIYIKRKAVEYKEQQQYNIV